MIGTLRRSDRIAPNAYAHDRRRRDTRQSRWHDAPLGKAKPSVIVLLVRLQAPDREPDDHQQHTHQYRRENRDYPLHWTILLAADRGSSLQAIPPVAQCSRRLSATDERGQGVVPGR